MGNWVQDIRGPSVLYSQFFCKPKTILKNKVNLKYFRNKNPKSSNITVSLPSLLG